MSSASTTEALQPTLLGCDFDGTQFDTSEPAPGGIDVNRGYALALTETLGAPAADRFWEQGGHNHRDPAEIVRSVAPELDAEAAAIATGQVVETKLEILESFIGTPLKDGTGLVWPRPTDGFVEAWQRIDEAKAAGAPIGTAVISNGHTRFEQKTFEAHGLSQPDIYLTHDVLQALALSMPYEQQIKPSPFPLQHVQRLWLAMLQATKPELPADQPLHSVYTGDDPIKDGQMAEAAGTDFVLLEPENARQSWQRVIAALNLAPLALQGEASV